MQITDIANKIKCLIYGHDTYIVRWRNKMTVRCNRKGGKKRGVKGSKTWTTRHYQIICHRCGKIIKHK